MKKGIENNESRSRVLGALRQAGPTGLLTHELEVQAWSRAVPSRVRELRRAGWDIGLMEEPGPISATRYVLRGKSAATARVLGLKVVWDFPGSPTVSLYHDCGRGLDNPLPQVDLDELREIIEEAVEEWARHRSTGLLPEPMPDDPEPVPADWLDQVLATMH